VKCRSVVSDFDELLELGRHIRLHVRGAITRHSPEAHRVHAAHVIGHDFVEVGVTHAGNLRGYVMALLGHLRMMRGHRFLLRLRVFVARGFGHLAYVAEIIWSEYAAESLAASHMTHGDLLAFLLNDPLHLAGIDERLIKLLTALREQITDIAL
jgi:hypothetical protein